MNNNVYKTLREYEWKEAQETGQITTALDKKDGFIHLSTAPQLAATLDLLFKDSDSLHLYSQLTIDHILESWKIKRGSYSLPEEVLFQAENLI